MREAGAIAIGISNVPELSMAFAQLLAYVTGLVNQELLLQNEYLAAENRILKAHLARNRSGATISRQPFGPTRI
jgi:hypothetical protein